MATEPEPGAIQRRVIVDTDTAGDDTQAILMAVRSDRLRVEGVTVVAGNVEFDYEVENAKYTLDLAGVADSVPVYEGARRPLLKAFEHADYVHGEGGLGGSLFPDTGIDSADGHAVEFILDTVRSAPGEVTLVCIGPLTNVAMTLLLEPDLNDLVDEVWVMGGAVNCLGNVTPAAEYNFWVDPDAAKLVCRELDVHLVDWGLTVREAVVDGPTLDRIERIDTPAAEFFRTIIDPVQSHARDQQDLAGPTQPDGLAVACMLAPELCREVSTYFVDVDERDGLTRGYSLVDEENVLGHEPRTRVVERIDRDLFFEMLVAMLEGDPPERPLDSADE